MKNLFSIPKFSRVDFSKVGICLLLGAFGLPTYAAEVSKPAPDFTLTDHLKKTHTLSKFKGQTVVLEWLNFDCPFVKKHYDSGNMQALQKKYTGLKVKWLSILSSAPGKQGNYSNEQITKLAQDKKSSATAILIDADGKVGRLYGAKTTPHLFVIGPKGDLVYAGAIDDHASTDVEDIAKSKNYVALALDAVLAGKSVVTKQTASYGCSIKY